MTYESMLPMKPPDEVRAAIQVELEDAHRYRTMGNEGRARVCARRAAGWAVGWYVEANRFAESHSNALEHLRWLADNPQADDRYREAAARLTTKLKPDGRMPFEQDLLEDARSIIGFCLDG